MNIWYYENGFSTTKTAPMTQYEPILWFSKSNSKWTYNVDDVRVPYKSTERLKHPVYYSNAKGEKCEWKPNPLGSMRGDVWTFPTLAGKAFKKEKTAHPAQKPEALITELIKAFCPKNTDAAIAGSFMAKKSGTRMTDTVKQSSVATINIIMKRENAKRQ